MKLVKVAGTVVTIGAIVALTAKKLVDAHSQKFEVEIARRPKENLYMIVNTESGECVSNYNFTETNNGQRCSIQLSKDYKEAALTPKCDAVNVSKMLNDAFETTDGPMFIVLPADDLETRESEEI